MEEFRKLRYGIVGGLGALGAADIFFKMVKAAPTRYGAEQPEFIFEQLPFAEGDAPGERLALQNGRKLYVFDTIRRFEDRGLNGVILPCFISHTFIEELRAEVKVPIVSIMDALREFISRKHPEARRLGILTSDFVREKNLFERHFVDDGCDLIYPSDQVQKECVMPAIYRPDGLKMGFMKGASLELLAKACQDLLAQGADLIVPGFTEIPIIVDALTEMGLPVIDSNLVYANYAVNHGGSSSKKQFKIGVVGGIGPAATVDFMTKIVRNTPAERDQDHIKVVVEQNPQIPDRTANLIGDGADPTISLYSTCKRLEAADADIIAIPCNTAHAFVERIQPYLSIPVVNMLTAAVEHIQKNLPRDAIVGLMATTGTVRSGVYHEAAANARIELLIPDEDHQSRVMNAIYGEEGIKAGFIEGSCREDLCAVLEHLAKRGARAVILGCTELPLILSSTGSFPVFGTTVEIIDPTEILAKKCVAFAMEYKG
ncbi:aspartate/glutamate racemase family protein [Collimonas sp.]|jgi:aspartate racemase|uniref:aspartate/glutamate racemase family protein n=1 Tax=Collimonas sp. TaxID=1963772 RepID=UPI002CE91E89|nr:amino acid racemase [Collimonas sp.]HWW07325.1 amino acid racemase [Collimonas sp.]